MSRGQNKLNPLALGRLKEPGYHSDGAGLYLQISPTGGKSWIFRYMLDGVSRYMGLGSFIDVSLGEARELALLQRKLVKQKIDPIEAREATYRTRLAERAKRITFDEAFEKYIQSQKDSWKNPKHIDQWRNTLTTYASPFIGKLSVADIDTGLVLECLEPIWHTKTETATRVRGRIEKVLDWAKTRGYRSGENPARWRGHLEHSLAAPHKIAVIRNQPALPYTQIAAFITALRKREALAARALEFGILTAARSADIRGATWKEVDLDEKLWSIHTERMKGEKGKERVETIHRIPLSDKAVELLKKRLELAGEIKPDDFVFTAQRGGTLSDATLSAVIKRMNEGDGGPIWVDATNGAPAVPHGFRSTFRDWAAECTTHEDKICEKALAHVVGDETQRAYQRGDLLEKRRWLMQDWCNFCEKTTGGDNVVPITSKTAA